MQTTFRLKAKDINSTLLSSLQDLFEGQEVEITIKSVTQEKEIEASTNALIQMIKDNRDSAPMISKDIDIRKLIDETHHSGPF